MPNKLLSDDDIGIGGPATKPVLSDADIGLGTAGGATTAPRATSTTPGRGVHAPAPTRKKTQEPSATLGENLRSVGDMVLGLPSFIAQVGVRGALDVVGAAKGEEHPASWAQGVMNEAMENKFNKFLAAPLGTLAGDEGKGTWMAAVGNHIAKNLNMTEGDKESQAIKQQILDTAMLSLPSVIEHGGKLINKVREAKAKTDTGAIDPDQVLNDIKNGPKPNGSPSSQTDIQKRINDKTGVKSTPQREKTTEQRGKEVADAFKDDPDLADYYKFKAEERIRDQEYFRSENARNEEIKKAKAEGRQPRNPQMGFADPRVLAAMGGAAVGAYSSDEDQLRNGLLGAALGYGAARWLTRERLVGKETPEQIKESAQRIYDQHGEDAAKLYLQSAKDAKRGEAIEKEVAGVFGRGINDIAAQQRAVRNNSEIIKQAVPDQLHREAISRAMDTGTIDQLPSSLKSAAQFLRSKFDDIGQRAIEAGVLKGMHEDYISHIIDWDKSGIKPSEKVFDAIFGNAYGGGASSRFAKARKHATFDELQEAIKGSGLQVKTMDVAEIYKIYGNSMERAIGRRNVLNYLKNVTDADGKPLVKQVTDAEPAPRGWQMINSPGLRGWAVSPEISQMAKHVFDASDPSTMLRAAHGLSQVVKRLNVVGSLFHAMSLVQSSWSSIGPLRTMKDLGMAAVDATLGTKGSGITQALDKFKKGGLGDEIDELMRGGLMLSGPEDVTRGLLSTAGSLSDQLAGKIGLKPNLEGKMGTVEKYTLGLLDKFTWDFLHTGLKANTALAMMEKMAREHPEIPREKIVRDVASHVNNTFGGLNWFQAASEGSTKFSRDLQMGLYSKNGRMLMQVLMFAPDWTLSTVRAFGQMFGEGTGAKGLWSPATKADLARRYTLRTAMTYFSLINAINMSTAGRPIWENNDPTRIEFPDGTSIQPMKHAMEPVQWIMHPDKEAANKLGFVPRAFMTLTDTGPRWVRDNKTGKTHMGTEPLSERIKEVAGSVLPFSVQTNQGNYKDKTARFLLSEIGLPKYGTPKTPEQMRQARRRKLAEERKKRKQ